MRAFACASLVLVTTLAAAVRPAVAAPDFSTSTIAIEPAAPREADVVTFIVRLRNSGSDDAASVFVTLDWPRMGFFVDATGVDGAEVDLESRRITLTEPLQAGGERRLSLRILAPRDSGGDALTLALRMSHFASRTDHYDRASVTIDTRLADEGLPAWRDYASLSWPETSCTILGGRLSAQSTTSGDTRPTSGAPRDDTAYVPVLGLRYLVDGRETYSSGDDTGSRLRIGGAGNRAAELTQWRVGSATPCWYSPSDPRDVVVKRGFGGAYVITLFPLPVFAIGLAGARALVSHR